eukprot:Gb_37100 [translate_table: standard]
MRTKENRNIFGWNNTYYPCRSACVDKTMFIILENSSLPAERTNNQKAAIIITTSMPSLR